MPAKQWPQDWKRSVFIPISKKGNAKECSNYCTTALILHASKVMLKIPQARLQQYMNQELPDVQAGFRKGRGTRDHIVNIRWIKEKAREFQKNIYFCFIDYANIVKAVYCHPAYLTYMQSITCKMPGWMKHKLESRLQKEHIKNLRYADDTTFMAEREEELKSLLMKVKEECEKAGLKLSIQKFKIMASVPITS